MRRLSMLTAALLFTACGLGEGDLFRRGFPTAEMVKLELPGQATASQPLEGTAQQRQALEGEISDFYRLTRTATVGVNAGVGAILGLVHAITRHPATTVTGNTAVWGPHTEALSPNTWKLTVIRNGPQDYQYALEGKAKGDPDTAFVTVLSGTHKPEVDAAGDPVEGLGAGTFTLDMDAARTLPENDGNVGRIDVAYARPGWSAEVTIDVEFTQVRDEETFGRNDASYRYRRQPGAGGAFEFSILKDIQNDGSALEKLTIKSRWKQTGTGRADVKASGGDLPVEATANECWDDDFKSRYLSASWDPQLGWGALGACAFPTAEYSSL
jgi:hypothetical protein